MTVSQQLRRAILDSGLSYYRIAKDTGLPHTLVIHFANRVRGLTTPTVDRLCKYLGLELRPVRPARRSKRKK